MEASLDRRADASVAAGVDRTRQPAGAAQRLGYAVAGRILRGMSVQKRETACPKLSGAVQFLRRE